MCDGDGCAGEEKEGTTERRWMDSIFDSLRKKVTIFQL